MRQRPDRRTVLRYTALQLPGWAFILFAGLAAREWLGIPERWVWVALVLWMAKDAALFPFVWRAYAPGTGEEARPLVGRLATARERLDPEGYVQVGSELWRAHALGAAIDEGARVRVVAKDGFTLSVVALEGDGAQRDA